MRVNKLAYLLLLAQGLVLMLPNININSQKLVGKKSTKLQVCVRGGLLPHRSGMSFSMIG